MATLRGCNAGSLVQTQGKAEGGINLNQKDWAKVHKQARAEKKAWLKKMVTHWKAKDGQLACGTNPRAYLDPH